MIVGAAIAAGCSGGDGGGGASDASGEPSPDAGPDMPPVEPLECMGITALPVSADGIDEGTTVGLADQFQATCFPSTGPDILYGFRAPGPLESLSISLLGSSYDTVLHAYVGGCTAAEEVACNDDLDGNVVQSFEDVATHPAGDYFIVVDGPLVGSSGDYVLTVLGRVAAGQPCDPNLAFLRCADGTTCVDRGAGPACLPALDCTDGVDADGDGTTDEDSATCDAPPVPSCPSPANTPVGTPISVSASASDDVRVVSTWWSVAAGPVGSSAKLSPFVGDQATIRPRLAGGYTLRYTAADDLGQLAACEIALDATVAEGLRVELVWNVMVPEETDVTDADLHLLHPTATNWFGLLDCHRDTCLGEGPPWGTGGTGDDPLLDRDDASGRGPEAITILDPQQGGDYRIGVHHSADNGFGAATVLVNLYCYGAFEQFFGPATLDGSNGDDSLNDFWKVADVSFGPSSCTVTNLGAVVTGADAAAAR